MKVLLLGFGNQGRKRYKIIKKFCNPTIFDPKYKDYSKKSVLNNKYNYIFICCIDQYKDYYLKKYSEIWEGKILIEKPLLINKKNKKKIINLSKKKKLYVAYNHKFDIGIINFIKKSKNLRNVYHANFKYLNGSAINVKKDKWRDRGSGVIYDLMPHLIDLSSEIFSNINLNFLKKTNKISFENKSPDYASIIYQDKNKIINYEVSYVSWKNHFSIDLYAKNYSIHLNGLNKWGKSTIEVRKRIFPSGKPKIKTYQFNFRDVSFVSETTSFLKNRLFSEFKQTSKYSDFIKRVSK